MLVPAKKELMQAKKKKKRERERERKNSNKTSFSSYLELHYKNPLEF